MSDVKTNKSESVDSGRKRMIKYINRHRAKVYDILKRAEKTLDYLGACQTMKSGEVYDSDGEDYSEEQYRVWREMRTTAWCELGEVLAIATNLPPTTGLTKEEMDDFVARIWIREVEKLMKQQHRWFPCKPWDDPR